MLTDSQRVELALPAHMLYGIAGSKCFSCFDDAGKVTDPEGAALLERARDLLKTACREPLADLPYARRGKLARRVTRVYQTAMDELFDQPAVKATLTVYYVIEDLIERGAIELFDGSAFAEGADIIMPMAEHGLESAAIEASARKQARRILDRLKREGIYA